MAESRQQARRRRTAARRKKYHSLVKKNTKEPMVDLTEDDFTSSFLFALNWYNVNRDRKRSRKYLLAYMKQNEYDKSQIDTIAKVGEHDIPLNVGWLARMIMNGNELPNSFVDRIPAAIKQAIDNYKAPKIGQRGRPKQKSAMQRFGPDIDGEIDEFITNNYKSDFNIIAYAKEKNMLGVHTRDLIEFYSRELSQIQEVKTTKDPELKEAYSYLTTRQLNRWIKFLDEIVTGLHQIAKENKKPRKPRKKKVKTPEQLVAKLKYQESSDEYELKSIDPTQLIGKKELIVFNTRYRYFGIYYSKDGFGVKGTTLQNFDETSTQKKIRKPKEFLQSVIGTTRARLTKEYKNVKSKEKPLNGRINENVILLKVF